MGFLTKLIDWVTTPYTIFLILKDPAVPAAVKWRAVIGLALMFIYIVSPVDVIPDVVPFSGWLDDLLVVPAGFGLLRLVTPGIDVAEKQNRAQKGVRKVVFWAIVSVAVMVFLALAGFGMLIYIVVKLIAG